MKEAHKCDVNVADICGSGWWAAIHALVGAIPCQSCREHGQALTSGMHDLVNVYLGKPIHNRANFHAVAAAFQNAIARDLTGITWQENSSQNAAIEEAISEWAQEPLTSMTL